MPPLTAAEKATIARWIDLGAPIDSQAPARAGLGWFADDLRPTLSVTLEPVWPPLGLWQVRVGAFDYYSGLAADALSVRADFPVLGGAAGELGATFTPSGDHVWTGYVFAGWTDLARGTVTVQVEDRAGNRTEVTRTVPIPADHRFWLLAIALGWI